VGVSLLGPRRAAMSGPRTARRPHALPSASSAPPPAAVTRTAHPARRRCQGQSLRSPCVPDRSLTTHLLQFPLSLQPVQRRAAGAGRARGPAAPGPFAAPGSR
jgi:hypothetical protein